MVLLADIEYSTVFIQAATCIIISHLITHILFSLSHSQWVPFGIHFNGAQVLLGINLKADPGESIALVGASGSGK